MKTIAALFVPFFALLFLSPANAQTAEPAPGATPTPEAAQAPDAVPASTPTSALESGTTAAPEANPLFTEPPALAPATEPEAEKTEAIEPKEAKRKAKEQSKKDQSPSAEDIKNRILFRQAETKALEDPKLHELLALAEASKTDPEKRGYLTSYYELLYSRMKQIDPSIATLIDYHLKRSLARLDQVQLRPLGQDPKLP